MNLTEYFDKCHTVKGALVAFMHALEDHKPEVAHIPTSKELETIEKIYAIAETEIRFIVNNDNINSTSDEKPLVAHKEVE